MASVEVHPGDDIRTLTGSMGPGTEIVFHSGTYNIDGNLDWTGVGTEATPIVLRGAGDGEVIIELTDSWVVAHLYDAQYVEIRNITFRGALGLADSGSGFGGLSIERVAHVTVDNCKFDQIGGSALGLGGNNDDVHITNNEITGTRNGHGIYGGCGDASCWTQNSEIRGNWIHDLGGDYAYGIIFEPGTQGVTIADNVVHGMLGRGIQSESTEYGPAVNIEGNAVWGTGDDGIAVYGKQIVRNNVIFDTGGNGIRSGVADDRVLEGQVISFNTIANTGDWAVQISDWTGKEGMVFANNAIANPIGLAFHVDDGGMDTGNYFSSNMVTGYVEGVDPYLFPNAIQPGGGYGDFDAADTHDYYPSSSSLLVDIGDAASEAYVPTIDFNGVLRDGEFPDIGAYERSAGSNPGWVVEPGFKTLTEGDGTTDIGGGCCKDKDSGEAGIVALFPLAIALRRRKKA